MNFVESLSMFHVDAKEIPCVTERGAPTEKTLGAPGVLYMDTDTGDLYKCRAADAVNGVYTWEKIGGSNSEYKLPIAGENLGGVKNGGNVVINPDGTMDAPNHLGITGATVGQTIRVAAVDETGKPTAWAPVDMPDSMSIGMELGVINPVADENNALFTDENGVIYSL